MANLTLTIDDETLRRARIKALELDTSVNALVRAYLSEFAGDGTALEARQRLVRLAQSSGAGSAAADRSWTREQLYEDRLP